MNKIDGNNINIATPSYEGRISIIRQDSCGFISEHNVPGLEGKDIYFSFKVLQNEGILHGDAVRFYLGKTVDKIWAYNVEKIEY